LQIIRLQDTTKDIEQFIRLEYRLYQDDPDWVAHLHMDTLSMLKGKKNPLFQSGPHAFFMVREEDGRWIGRILTGLDENLNEVRGFQQGYFSMFECENNAEAAKLLLDAAVQWQKEHCMHTMIGPLSPSNGDDRKGFLILGEGQPVLLNAYTKRYYPALIENYGFVKNDDHMAFLFDPDEFDLERHEKVVGYAIKRSKFRIDRLNPRDILGESKDIKEIIDNSIPEEWDYLVAPTLQGVIDEFKSLKQFYNGHFCYIARVGSRPVGFLFALPDYFQVLKKMKGKILPFGWFYFLTGRKKIDRVRAFTQMVVNDYHKKGVNHAMYLEMYYDAMKTGIHALEASCVDETNYESRLSVEKSGGKLYRIYRTYRYNF
jgi:hypothetical protein